MGIGEFFSLASAVVWAFAVIYFKRSGESMPPFALNLFKNALAFSLMIPTLWIMHGLVMPDFGGRDVLIMLASGFIGVAVADTLYFKALNTIGASRTGIVSALYSPSVILLSFLFLGERLHAPQLIGFGLVLMGVIMVSYRQPAQEIDTAMLKRGVPIAVLAVVLMAIGVVMVKRILEEQPFLWVVQVRLFGGLAGMILMMLLTRRTAAVIGQYRAPHHWRRIIVASLLGSYLGMMFWLAGYKYTLASVAAVLNETASVFIVLLAWPMLRETLSSRKLIGVAFAFGGVVLMVLG